MESTIIHFSLVVSFADRVIELTSIDVKKSNSHRGGFSFESRKELKESLEERKKKKL